MKKNKNGFVLAETLVVTVFVMSIFTIIYLNFYPILGKYQEREFFDDVDSKYNAYWLKRLIQDENVISKDKWKTITEKIQQDGAYELICTKPYEQCNYNCPEGDYWNLPWEEYKKYEKYCSRSQEQRNYINDIATKGKKMMQSYVNNTGCSQVFITKYNLEVSDKLDEIEDPTPLVQFKGNEKDGEKNYTIFTKRFKIDNAMQRYIDTLPAYKFPSTRDARYRIIAQYNRVRDESKYSTKRNYVYAFATIEVKRN